MIKSALVALTVVTAVFAQSGMPTGTSATCSTFLNNTLNADTTINSCLTALIDSTEDFDPTNNNGANPSSSSVTSALNNICGSDFHSCDAATVRSMLANFYTACSTDMLGTNGDGSNGNKQVISIYDVLYIIVPLKNAICAKDGSKYCVNVINTENTAGASGSSSIADASVGGTDQPASGTDAPTTAGGSSSAPASSSSAPGTSVTTHASSSSSAPAASSTTHARRSLSVPASSLYRRDDTTNQTTLGIAPEAAQYNSIGLPYLFTTPNMTTTELCTPCTAEVVGSYISFESVTPYALGIANSPMLSGQVALWNKIKTCPGNFASSLLNNATGSTSSSSTGGASTVSIGFAQFVGAAVVALVGGVMLF